MNEYDWAILTDPSAMLDHLEGSGLASDRKLRLLACGCVRAHWHLLRWPVPRQAVQSAEQFAEGLLSDEGREEARQQAEISAGNAPGFDRYVYYAAMSTLDEAASQAARQTIENLRLYAIHEAAEEVAPHENERRITEAAAQAEALRQCNLIREVFGNPFRPATIDRSWLEMYDHAAGSIARWIDQERRLEELPYLSDALTDAGCTDENLLRHLRQMTGHVRGCWALDAIMGRQ